MNFYEAFGVFHIVFYCCVGIYSIFKLVKKGLDIELEGMLEVFQVPPELTQNSKFVSYDSRTTDNKPS